MPFVFRNIGNKFWYSADQRDFKKWLSDGELVADVFKELRTTRGSLSVFRVEDDASNLDRVVSAYACTRNSLSDLDFVLVPLDAINAEFEATETPGQTADDEVNAWHLDIEHLSAGKLLLLAQIFRDHRSSMDRYRKRHVTTKIRESLEKRQLDFERIHEALQPKFSDLLTD